jgi:hypothetical protein
MSTRRRHRDDVPPTPPTPAPVAGPRRRALPADPEPTEGCLDGLAELLLRVAARRRDRRQTADESGQGPTQDTNTPER